MPEQLLINARILPMTGNASGEMSDADSILVVDQNIQWLGLKADCPVLTNNVIDCHGQLVTPSLIDCHTHLVYAGNRAREFELRLQGVSYTDIAQQGGGIMSTVKDTREASEEALFDQSLPRLQRLIAEGVTTVEIKSGYGLDLPTEIKMLRVAKRLAEATHITIQKTLLAAHAVPTEFLDDKDGYIDLICEQILPYAHAEGLVDAVDGFIEGVAFSVAQVERVFIVAETLGLPIKAHVEQLSYLGGAAMAAQRSALSVDHIEYLKEQDMDVIKKSGTVAVLLPGAFYVLNETQLPAVSALRTNQIPMAVATDCNPGTSPLNSILLAMNMACTLFKLTPIEALQGVTLNAAKALGLANKLGSIQEGKQADIAVWQIDDPVELSYYIGVNPCNGVMSAGEWIKLPG